MANIQRLSNTSAATNYAPEIPDGTPTVTVRGDAENSPYLLHPEWKVPLKVVLTKSNCAGYCQDCPSVEFVQTLDSFERGCRSRLVEPGVADLYSASIVAKAVHLFRDPFDNLVARKNMEIEARLKSDSETWTASAMVNSTKRGLKAWCDFIDAEFQAGETDSPSLLDDETIALFDKVPCAPELFRYVQWNNLALKMVNRRKLPVLFVHYEDLVSNGKNSLNSIADFLGLHLMDLPYKAIPESSYEDLFDDSDGIAIARFLHTFATAECWQHIRRYLAPRWIEEQDASPRIALLLSFPNSGTSFTLRNSVLLSNFSVATNYGDEVEAINVPLIPLRNDIPGAPFVLYPELRIPPVVLTKTHCNPQHLFFKFEKGCRTTHKRIGGGGDIRVEYPSWLVDRIVHLFRSPFDNIVARKHLGIQKRRQRGVSEEILSTFTDTKEGVHKWCEFLDDTFGENVRRWVPTAEARNLLKQIPCYSDLLHYVKFHENAIMVSEKYQVPEHILYYEDYARKYEETTRSLYEFLDFPIVGKPHPFALGKTYDHFFEKHEITAMAQVVRAVATPKCWTRLRRYFITPLLDPAVRIGGASVENGTLTRSSAIKTLQG